MAKRDKANSTPSQNATDGEGDESVLGEAPAASGGFSSGSGGKKAVLLRLPPDLWEELNAWARDELRSFNAQIEYLLRDAVRRNRKRRAAPDATSDAGMTSSSNDPAGDGPA